MTQTVISQHVIMNNKDLHVALLCKIDLGQMNEQGISSLIANAV